MLLTNKQREILALIIEGNEDGSAVDMDQLLERISYKPSKDALHFSIRYLSAKGMIEKSGLEKRRGRSRSTISPTAEGMLTAKGVTRLVDREKVTVVSEAESDLLDEIESV